MKTIFAFICGTLMFVQMASADTRQQNALKETLGSDQLAALQQQPELGSMELTDAKVVKTATGRRGREHFQVTLVYSDVRGGTADCTVVANLLRGEMEMVAPGGAGFRIRETWQVEDLKLVACSP